MYCGEWCSEKNQLTLRNTNQRASQLAVSPDGSIVWRLNQGRLLVLMKADQKSDNWQEIQSGVKKLALNETTGFILTLDGHLMAQVKLSAANPFRDDKQEHIQCPEQLKHITCTSELLLCITVDGKILGRTGMCSGTPLGNSWSHVPSLNKWAITDLTLQEHISCGGGPPSYTVFVTNDKGQLFYTQADRDSLLLEEMLLWYQVRVPGTNLNLEGNRSSSTLWAINAQKDSCLMLNTKSVQGSVWKTLDFAETKNQLQRVKKINANALYGNEGTYFYLPDFESTR